MAFSRNLKHIVFASIPERLDYASCNAGGVKARPTRIASEHGASLLSQFTEAWNQATAITNATAVVEKDGIYLSVEIADKCEDIIKSLAPKNKGTRVCNVKKSQNDETENLTQVTVFIPNKERQSWIKKITEYKEQQTSKGNPKHQDLFASVEAIHLALVKALWTDKPDTFPGEIKIWCEAWLDVPSGKSQNDIKK